MFPYYLSLRRTPGWWVGMELREGKNPDQDRFCLFFSNFFFFFLPRGHTEGKARRKTTILGSDWVMQENISSWSVPMPNKQKTRNPTWDYAQTLYYTSYQPLMLTIPSNGHLACRLLGEPTSQKSSLQKPLVSFS